MNLAHHLITEWPIMTRAAKRGYCLALNVEPFKRAERSYSPRHPVFGTPSRETFADPLDAGVAQVDWFIALVN